MDDSLSSPNPELGPKGPPSNPKSPVNNKTPPYAAIIGGIGGALVLLSLLVLTVYKRRKKVKSFGGGGDRCRRFSLKEVRVATCMFNDNCVIGKGGYGKVYIGKIDDYKKTVAIKRLDTSSKQGPREFLTEIGFLSKLRHDHLVSLIGYCDDKGEMILVYDYMAHGTLQEHLYNNRNPPLSWQKRLHICIGAAKGLQYLHTSANRVIIHRDVKSTNILLDENWDAKVSDFGMTKLGPKDKGKNHVTNMVKGTFGYLDPEYFRTGEITEKSDVYSFGVVLFEVLCARPAVIKDRDVPYQQENLAECGKFNYRKGFVHEIIDPNLKDKIAPKCLMKFAEVAYNCLKKDRSKRPTMSDVVWGLEFALKLQEDAEKRDCVIDKAVFEDHKLPFLKVEESTTAKEYSFFGSTEVAIRHGMSFADISYEFESETILTKMMPPTSS